MGNDTEANTRSRSTTWVWEMRKVRRSPERAPASQSPKASPWPPREPLTLTVRYLGGSEAWVEVTSRGQTRKMPGHRYLLDALIDVWGRQP